MGIAVHADLVAGVHNHLHLLREGLDRMARDEPGRPDAELVEKPDHARRADLAGEQAARDIAGRILAAIGAEPAGDRIDIDADGAQDILLAAARSRRGTGGRGQRRASGRRAAAGSVKQ